MRDQDTDPSGLNDQAGMTAYADRFRRVANHYRRRVAEAYEGDVARAGRDSDQQVAATVAAWEQAHGIEPRDWHAIGTSEGRDADR